MEKIDTVISFEPPDWAEHRCPLGEVSIQEGKIWVRPMRMKDRNGQEYSDNEYALEICKTVTHEVLHIFISPKVASASERKEKVMANDTIIETIATWASYGEADINWAISVGQEIDYIDPEGERVKEILDFLKRVKKALEGEE